MRWSFEELALAAMMALLGVEACLAHWRRRRQAAREGQWTAERQAIALLEIVAEAAIALDDQGRVALANPAAMRLLDAVRYAGGERRFNRLFTCPTLHQWIEGIRWSGSVATETLEIEVTGDEQDHRWFRVRARAWAAGGQKTATQGPGIVVLLEDVSKQKTAQRRNAELVSGVSHEMKTPLAGIKAYVELLADGDAEDSATQAEFLEVISSQADRLLQLVDNLVTVAEVEAATAGAGKRLWRLETLLDEGLRIVAPAAAAKKIAVESDIDCRSLSVLVDRRLLVQAAVQLLLNAVNYTLPGGKVVLRSRAKGDRVRIEIEDNGVGLSPEDCAKVFEKFYRVPQTKTMAPGTGLGLPLAKHIVESLHGGKLSVESQAGEGSLFAVELTLAGTAVPDAAASREHCCTA